MTLDLRDLNSIASQFVEALRKNIIDSGHSATGEMANSLKSIVKYDDRYLMIYLDTVEYFKYVNDGRSAGKFPPINKIKEWIKVKHILPTPIKGKLPTENQLAYLIGRKIALEGTKGTHSLEKTEQQFRLEEKVINELLNIFEKEIDKIIKEIYEVE